MKLGFISEGGLVKKIQLIKGKILELRIGSTFLDYGICGMVWCKQRCKRNRW